MAMKDFQKLKIWQRSHQMALLVYGTTAQFPKTEIYGLVSQMRRAALSIPTNIAEGCGRGGDVEFRRFMQFAMGSATELEYEFLVAKDLGFIKPEEYGPLAETISEIKRMLTSFFKKLKAES
jgi:four helix bundle protein